ncbi:MAG: hydroxymethylglutaryl-CoA lyase [Flavobacteriales bacterium]
MNDVKIIDCPRDAMQGIKEFIPTAKKIQYIQLLLEAGFDTLDFGSFVSPKAIPQLADTKEVLTSLDLSKTKTKLLAIVANERGATEACEHAEIKYLGYPFSISETFQQRNTNASIAQSVTRVSEIQNLCVKHNKELVVYISMAFGNPYGDTWSSDIAINWVKRLHEELNIHIIALADTIGVSNPKNIQYMFKALIPAFPKVEFGAHLHTTPTTWQEKVEAAWNAGCRRYDGAVKGFGGCPMAADDLTGNMPTEKMVEWFSSQLVKHGVNEAVLAKSIALATRIFPS